MEEAVALLGRLRGRSGGAGLRALRQAQHLQVAGQPSRAESPLREAIAVLAAHRHTLLESLARATLALCRLDQGDVPAARSEIARAVQLLDGVDTRYLERLEVARWCRPR